MATIEPILNKRFIVLNNDVPDEKKPLVTMEPVFTVTISDVIAKAHENKKEIFRSFQDREATTSVFETKKTTTPERKMMTSDGLFSSGKSLPLI